ncbi:hypothetical protein [Sphingomonas bacterium]|uniref:hypothetical protein n=1 Tax=Sphingomonas bacterium TaxID=1895847 RepID=UPI00157555AD|nr:hypothetical protein [Sphingomonas bacterium]
MGKKKSEKKPGKLPKRIAGVKLPKEARRQAERAIAELRQPIVREMIAGALGMAANAMAKQASAARTAPHCAPKAEAEPKPAGAKSGGEQFAEIAAGLAVAGLGRLFEKMSAANEAAKKPESKG